MRITNRGGRKGLPVGSLMAEWMPNLTSIQAMLQSLLKDFQLCYITIH